VKKAGFLLIEGLIVIAIMGCLLMNITLVLAKFSNMLEKSKKEIIWGVEWQYLRAFMQKDIRKQKSLVFINGHSCAFNDEDKRLVSYDLNNGFLRRRINKKSTFYVSKVLEMEDLKFKLAGERLLICEMVVKGEKKTKLKVLMALSDG
jgi:type II secretory pathway component PulJ